MRCKHCLFFVCLGLWQFYFIMCPMVSLLLHNHLPLWLGIHCHLEQSMYWKVKFHYCMVTTTEVEDPGAVVQHFLEQKYLISAIVGHSKGQIQITAILIISKLKFFGD
ncbi:hypothetical protein VNO80_02481 [Phaseolus coccineus]|uniref:Uncharacterized protein n=1 Tax=Phaseolus coccineus TaxID=3886 RepID=A0AAN9RLK4_PHACN